ncbi:MAG: hypothetical protein MZW92_42170 [Comamonadaceae bacterium]|nr:hypothetical protein [Comamonadaceae bacterium]
MRRIARQQAARAVVAAAATTSSEYSSAAKPTGWPRRPLVLRVGHRVLRRARRPPRSMRRRPHQRHVAGQHQPARRDSARSAHAGGDRMAHAAHAHRPRRSTTHVARGQLLRATSGASARGRHHHHRQLRLDRRVRTRGAEHRACRPSGCSSLCARRLQAAALPGGQHDDGRDAMLIAVALARPAHRSCTAQEWRAAGTQTVGRSPTAFHVRDASGRSAGVRLRGRRRRLPILAPMDIADLRKSYERDALDETASAADPLQQFERWLQQAMHGAAARAERDDAGHRRAPTAGRRRASC